MFIGTFHELLLDGRRVENCEVANAQVLRGTRPGLSAEARAKFQAEARARAEVKVKAEVQAEARVKFEIKAEPQVKAEPRA